MYFDTRSYEVQAIQPDHASFLTRTSRLIALGFFRLFDYVLRVIIYWFHYALAGISKASSFRSSPHSLLLCWGVKPKVVLKPDLTHPESPKFNKMYPS